MAEFGEDRWYESAALELARRVEDRYTIASWKRGVWERVRSAGVTPIDAVEMLLQHPPTTLAPRDIHNSRGLAAEAR